MSALSKIKLSVEEYLQGEEQDEFRHEYVMGRVYAMTTITTNNLAV